MTPWMRSPPRRAAYVAKRQEERLAPLLRDVATILLDCGLRPEKCSRLRGENVRDGSIEIEYGKTANALRRAPMSPRISALLEDLMSKMLGNSVPEGQPP